MSRGGGFSIFSGGGGSGGSSGGSSGGGEREGPGHYDTQKVGEEWDDNAPRRGGSGNYVPVYGKVWVPDEGLKKLATLEHYLVQSDIKLIRAEYLTHLVLTNERMPRRQEAEEQEFTDVTGKSRSALVSHDEVKYGLSSAIVCSVAHAWESREHPDPLGHQLAQIARHASLFSAAFTKDVWVYFDYTSLFQFKRTSEQEASFRKALWHEYILYAHENTITFRVESLSPEDDWQKMQDNLVTVYHEPSDMVKPVPLKDLLANRLPFGERGCCCAEVQLSCMRSNTAQNQQIDVEGNRGTMGDTPDARSNRRNELKGKAPTVPDQFVLDMETAHWTRLADKDPTMILQKKLFEEKAKGCEEWVVQGLPIKEMQVLGRALPYFNNLNFMSLENFVSRKEEAEVFAKALATTPVKTFKCCAKDPESLHRLIQALIAVLNNMDVAELDLSRPDSGWAKLQTKTIKELAEKLQTNKSLKRLDLSRLQLGDEAVKDLTEMLKRNSSVTHLILRDNNFADLGPSGLQALTEMVAANSNMIDLDLRGAFLSDAGAQALLSGIDGRTATLNLQLELAGATEALKEALPVALRKINKDRRPQAPLSPTVPKKGPFGAQVRFKTLVADLERNQTPRILDLSHCKMDEYTAKVLAQMLRVNKTITEVKLNYCIAGFEGIKALAEALTINQVVASVSLRGTNLGDAGAEAMAEVLKGNQAIKKIIMSKTDIREQGTKALADALQVNEAIEEFDLSRCDIGVPGAKALATAFRDRGFIDVLSLDDCPIGDGGAQAISEMFPQCRIMSLKLRRAGLGDAGAKALAKNLNQLQMLYLDGNKIRMDGAKALAGALQKSTVKCVALQENLLGTAGVQALGEALSANQTIEKLLVGGNIREALGQRFDSRLVLEVDPAAGLSDEERHLQHFQDELLQWQKFGTAPLPAVRLAFVGRGRAGKTTTLRRLKGDENIQEGELSTYGIEVWAGEVAEEMDGAFESCKNRLLDECAVKNFHPRPKPENLDSNESEHDGAWDSGEGAEIRKEEPQEEMHPSSERSRAPQTEKPDNRGGVVEVVETSRRSVTQGAAEEPNKQASPGKLEGNVEQRADVAERSRGGKEDVEDAMGATTARRMDADLMIPQKEEISSKKGISPRLQCFDFPGQKEYALLNMIYFHGRGIYLIFCDMSEELEEAWKDLKFWLWAVGRYATSPTQQKKPPILVVGTKAGQRKFSHQDIDDRISAFLHQMPHLRSQVQSIFGSCYRSWVFPLDNFGDGWQLRISFLRQKLGDLALDLLTTEHAWREMNWQKEEDMPQHVGLQSAPCPVPWIQAHELLTQLAEGVKLRVDKAAVKLKEGKGGRAELESELVGRHYELNHDVLAPAGCEVRFIASPQPADSQDWSFDAVQDVLNKSEGQFISVLIACDFLHLKQVETLLGQMAPLPIPIEDVTEVLQLMNELGAIFWLKDDRLRDAVALNVRKLSVALSALMSLRFWDESQFEHGAAFQQKLQKQTERIPGDVLRFQTSGVATWKLLDCLWKDEFDSLQQELMLEVMLRKGVMTKCAVAGEYIVPCCLPMTYLPEPPRDLHNKGSAVGYIDLDGFISSNLLPTIADHLCNTKILQLTSPPQLFRNLIELRSAAALIILSVVSVTKQRLLRVQVMTQDDTVSSKNTASRTAEAFWNALGFDHKTCPELQFWETVQDLTSALNIENVKPSKRWESFRDVDVFIKLNPSLQPNIDGCPDSKRAHALSAFLEERFYRDLSPELLGFISMCSLQKFSRPAGSFRFKSVKFPGDVDIEEYIIAPIDEADKDPAGFDPQGRSRLAREFALQVLSKDLQKRCQEMEGHAGLHWGGLKAGHGMDEKTLTWTQEDMRNGYKDVTWEPSKGQKKHRMELREALGLGHNTWTAKIDCFAKTTLFADSNENHELNNFYEVTNVIRFGFGTQVITPVTKEKDFLTAVDRNIHLYGFEHPKAMKYVKRLWERSAFFSQRNIDLNRHLLMLEELKPILEHWVAEISQIAAHAETLINMLKRNHMEKDAIEDLETFRQKLVRLEEKLPKDAEGEEGSKTIQQVLKCLECSEDASAKGVSGILEVVQDLLECCVEVVVINKLGGFSRPVSVALQERWTFPSDHPPIAATISACCGLKVDINLASWNVLNQHYMKYINNDKQGLKRSRIAEISDAERQEAIYMKVARMLMHPTKPKHVVCLQECWPPLLDLFRMMLPDKFELLTTNAQGKKNAEAMIYDKDMLEQKDVYVAKYQSDPQKAILEVLFQLRSGKGMFRVVTTHLPGNPYGKARRTFCDFVRKRQDLYRKNPTILLADMNFPDEAIRPLLKHRGQLDHVEFLNIPYPTNICQGSLLPKRIDCIASFSKEIEVKPLEANDVLDGLSEVVELLKSRSLELALPQEHVSS